MQIKNTSATYGAVSIMLHWLMAIAIIGLYFLGDYMVELDYYSPLYHTLPEWHKSIGILVALALLLRLLWNYSQNRPMPNQSTAPAFTHWLAKLGHWALYLFLLVMIMTGYLIATAEGASIEVFNWFQIPAFTTLTPQNTDLMGDIHAWVAKAFMLFVLVHAGAALLHHFYWKDDTFVRMFGRSRT